MKIEKLNWDSEFFGLKIGKVSITQDDEFDWRSFKETADTEKYELIYVFKFHKMLPREIAIKAELDLVDIHITMAKNFIKEDYLNVPYDFRTELTEVEKKGCYEIADETAIVSRFYKEKKLGPNIAKKLYRKWIDNALDKSFADGLFLVKKVNSVVGIQVIKTDIENKVGFCSVIGVDSNYKGLGIGENLWEQSFGFWANERNIVLCKVSFSFQNVESFNFHLKRGFNNIEEIKYIYHFRNTFL